jgi:hypothetical protein
VSLAQEGVAEKAGQRLDDVGRGLRQGVFEIGEGLRNRFATVRADVHRMGAQPRVYARLHWDRTLNGSRIEVHMMRGGTVLLRGAVPDNAARQRAVAIARDTVGVAAVIDELTTFLPDQPPARTTLPDQPDLSPLPDQPAQTTVTPK